MEREGRYSLVILAAVALSYFIENFLRAAPSAVMPLLIKEMNLTHSNAGFLISSYFVVYSIMQIPSGILSNRLGPRRTIIYFTIVTIGGNTLFYLSKNYATLIIAQLILGLGTSVFYINAIQLVSNWFSFQKKASAIGVMTATSGLASFIAYIGFPLSSIYLGGWRLLYLFGILILVGSFVMNYAVLKDRPSDAPVKAQTQKAPLWASLKEAIANRGFHPLLVVYFFNSFNYVFISWLPQFMIDGKGLDYLSAGLVSSVANVMGIAGNILLGIISDRFRQRRKPMVVFSLLATLTFTLFINLPRTTPTPVFVLLSGTLGFFSSYGVLVVSMISESLPSEKVGVSLGIANAMGCLVISLITTVYGSLVDLTGNYGVSNSIFLVSGTITALMGIFFLRETYGMNNVKKIKDQSKRG
jgi:MFS family permease